MKLNQGKVLLFTLLALAGAARAAPGGFEPPLPREEVTPDLVYNLLAGEIAAARGVPGASYEVYTHLAQTRRAPWYAYRAYEAAASIGAAKEMLSSAKLWERLAPGSLPPKEAASCAELSLKGADKNLENKIALLTKNLPEADKDAYLAELAQCALSFKGKKNEVFAFLKKTFGPGLPKKGAALPMALLAAECGDPQNAFAWGMTAYEADPENWRALLLYAYGLADRDLPKTLSILRAYLEKDPDQPDVRFTLVKALLKNGDLKAAVEALAPLKRQALDNPKTTALSYAVASAYIEAKQYSEAKEMLSLYLKHFQAPEGASPSSEVMLESDRARITLGAIAFDAGDSKEAARRLLEVAPSSPLYAAAQKNLSEVYTKAGEAKNALSVLERLIRKYPDDASLYIEKVRAEGAFEMRREAWADAQRALKKFPEDKAVLYWAALAAQRAGEAKRSEELFSLGIERYPEEPDFYNALGYNWIDAGVNLEKGRSLVEKALSMSPKNPMYLDSLGWYYYQIKNYRKALEILTGAFDALQEAEIGLHLVKTHEALGQRAAARRLLESLEKNFPQDADLKAYLREKK